MPTSRSHKPCPRHNSARAVSGGTSSDVTYQHMPFSRLLLYLATAAALGLVSYALLAQPPPLWLSEAALVGYIALVMSGILM